MVGEIATNVLLYGRLEPLPEQIPLRAGPLSLIYEDGDLRYIKLGDREVIRRIYAAVRDRNWVTVPGELSDVSIESKTDSFKITYDSRHKSGDIDFGWHGEIEAWSDGTIMFGFTGEARSTFLKNRIGFCVLHPMLECAGAPCRAEYANGESTLVAFPKLVTGEQPVPGLVDLRAITHEVENGIWAEVRFDGDIFETEDQRNWIDASFKTFCTPLRLPFPVEIKAGTRISQSATVRLVDHRMERVNLAAHLLQSQPAVRPDSRTVEIDLLPKARPMPQIGLGISHDSPQEGWERLRMLNLTHLRCDLQFTQSDWNENLRRAILHATNAAAALEIALHLRPHPEGALQQFAKAWGAASTAELPSHQQNNNNNKAPKLLRLLVLSDGHDSTTKDSLIAARRSLSPLGCPIGGGTNADFYQLNQTRPPVQLCDFICWSINPQVHAFDNTSLVETPATIAAQIASAREYFPGKPLVISPVTLKPRFNPVATSEEAASPADELPPEVDPRQMSLLGASWTLAAVKHLAESEAQGATFYETIGCRGVMERSVGLRMPAQFRSLPGTVFPLFHVLADVAESPGAKVQFSRSSDSQLVESLCVQSRTNKCLLLANLSPKQQAVGISNFASKARVRSLNAANAREAMATPELFRAKPGASLPENANRLEIQLAPYGYARLDAEL